MKLEIVCRKATQVIISTGRYIKSQSGNISASQIKTKGVHDFVTRVDRQAEKKLVKGLKNIFPPAGFLTEEKTIAFRKSDFTWIIDPLDGTTNFIHGVPCYTVSVALMKGGFLVAGIIYDINLRECFYGWLRGGAYMNGKRIYVSKTSSLDNALLATGFPFYDYSRLTGYMNLMKYLLKNSRGMRRMGSAAIDLAWVACGRFDGFYEYGLSAWDVAAGALLVQEAGGSVSDFKGGNNYLTGKEIVACNNNIFSDLKRLMKRYL